MSRRVALIAPPWYPVPPHGYGGIELVVGLLADGLRARGHHVILIGAEGSPLAHRTLAPPEWRADLGHANERLRELAYAGRVVEAMRSIGDVDVIHDHCGSSTLLGLSLARIAPVVHTVHGPVTEAWRTVYESMPAPIGLIAISGAQRAAAPRLPWVGTVHNAVDIDALEVRHREDREPYLICLARVCPDKGQHLAIEVAKRTGIRLVLAGKIDPGAVAHDYYQRYIAPAVDGDRVVHVHNVAGRKKTELLSRATALLAPLQWDEPFGLSVVEAMASGTPAISFPLGAAPELITPGLTGFLAEDVDEMVEAVVMARSIDPDVCAASARERFSPAAMARGYAAVYAGVIGDATPVLPPVIELATPPVTVAGTRPPRRIKPA